MLEEGGGAHAEDGLTVTPRVLVTDGEQRSTLAVVRSLGRAGFEVHVCACSPGSLAASSRFASQEHVVPDPSSSPEGFTHALGALLREHDFHALLPMTDVVAPLALEIRPDFPAVCIPFPDAPVWDRVSDKAELMATAGSLGVPVPRQVVVEERVSDQTRERVSEEVQNFAADVGFPVVLKPHRSAVVSEGGIQKFGVSMVHQEEDLMTGLADYPAGAFPVLVQQAIHGPGIGGFFLARDGEVLAEFSHRRLREMPPTGGVSVLRESIEVRADLRAHSQALLKHFGWTGVAMVEFKEDESTGTLYLMEINGRFWGSLQLAIDAGVDFPLILMRQIARLGGSDDDVVGGVRPLPAYATGIQTRWLWGDVDHLLWLLRKRHLRALDPALPGPVRAVARFLLPWRPSRHYEVLRLSDPRPFLRESRAWIRDVLG